MTKQEAYQEMINGNKITHEYYTDEEYTFINNSGEIETEDGCTHGGHLGEFWQIYQKWQTGWSIYVV